MCNARSRLASSMNGLFSPSERVFHSVPSRFEISELRHLATLTSGPNHERVHRPLDPIRIVLVLLAALVPLDVVVVGWRWGLASGPCRQRWGVLRQLCVVVMAEVLVAHLVVRRGRRGRWRKIGVTIPRINGRRGTSVVMMGYSPGS